MTEFSHRSLHGAKSGRRRLFIVTLVVVIVFLFDIVSGGIVRSGVRTAAGAVWTATGTVRTSIAESGYFRLHRSLASENASLRSEAARYKQEAAGYQVLKRENEELRALLALAQTEKGITAPVISSFRSSPYGTFLVGAGVGDGVTLGSLVLTDGAFVIGVVNDVKMNTTSVSEVFAAGNETDARIGTAVVSVEGRGGGNARALVPRGIAVAAGDAVTSSIYSGRAIGIVGKVESTPTSADQTVYISLPVNVSTLHYVYILTAHE